MTKQFFSPIFQIDEPYSHIIKAQPHNYSPFRLLLQIIGSFFAPFMQEGVRISLLEPDENNGIMNITCLYASQGIKRLNEKIQISECPFFEELRLGDAIITDNTHASQGVHGWPGSADICSELLYPIISDDQIIYAICVQYSNTHHWDNQEILYIERIALSLYRHILSYEHVAFRSHLLDAVNEAIAVTDGNGLIVFWNLAAERMFGYSSFEAKGISVDTLLQLDRSSAACNAARKSLVENDFCSFEIECTHKNGPKLLVEVLGNVYRNEKYEVSEAVFSMRDITEKQIILHALRRQNSLLKYINRIHVGSSSYITAEKLSNIFLDVIAEATGSQLSFIAEVGKDGFLHNDAIGLSRLSHTAACHLRDYPQQGQNYMHDLHKKIIAQRKPLLLNTVTHNYNGTELPAEHPIIQRFLGIPFLTDDEVTGIVAVANKDIDYTEDDIAMLEDLTPAIMQALQKRRAETTLEKSEQHAQELIEQLGATNKSQNGFLSVLSHELRNPLATIVACLHLLEVNQDSEQLEKARKIMKRQTEQLCRLTDDLLDHARILNNKIQLRKTSVDLNFLLQSIIEDYSTLFEQKGLHVISAILPEHLYCYADSVRLKQLIGNLMDNAIKYTPKDGTVTVSLTAAVSEALIQIQDNGRGISPEVLPRLFDPFMQEARFPDKNNSLGLGLSIALGIAELHGGSIEAFSEGINKGATFRVHLPLPVGSDSTTPQTSSARRFDRSLKILFIDNNVDFSRILCAMLQYAGHKTSSVQNGIEGIEMARSFLPDVIFCDIELPGTNGFEFARQIHSDPVLQNIYLIAIASISSKDLLASETGFDSYIYKPVDMAVVKNLLSNIP